MTRTALFALCWLAPSGLAMAQATAPGSPGDRALPAVEHALARRVNEIRAAEGQAPLRGDPALARMAREHSCSMARRGTLSHIGRSGQTLGDRVRAAGKGFAAVGENVASHVRGSDPVEPVVRGWMASPGHRDNILDEGFTETGVGVCRAASTYFFTQVFLRPRR